MNKSILQQLLRISSCIKSTKNVHSSSSRRKLPVNPNLEEELPTFEYSSKNPLHNRLYVLGRAETGALGVVVNSLKGYNFIKTPKRSSFAEYYDIQDVACGYGFTAFVVNSPDNESLLYGCGINTDSQLGYHCVRKDKRLDYILIPQPIYLPIKSPSTCDVLSLSAGRAHLVVLTDEGLFTLGNNAYGQCGRPIIDNEKYSGSAVIHTVTQFDPKEISSVHCGQDHTLLLTKNGMVYSCGWGADGQTGLGHYKNESEFSIVRGDIEGEHIVKVAGVADCVLALNARGEVFGWGNSEYGQLPLDDSNVQQINLPIHLNENNRWGKVIDIAAGGSFCMILNEQGHVYVWGYGLLGLGPEVMQTGFPIQLPSSLFGTSCFNSDCFVQKITCGISHMAAVNTNGDLYLWGRNTAGNLGLGHLNDQFFPLKVALGGMVKKVTCGVDHTMILCDPFA